VDSCDPKQRHHRWRKDRVGAGGVVPAFPWSAVVFLHWKVEGQHAVAVSVRLTMCEPLIIGSNGYVSRIDPETGEELWRTPLLPGLLSSTSYTDVAVLLRGESVFAGTYGHLFCLALDSGEIQWRNELKGMGYNDVALAMEGVAVQFLTKVERKSSST